MSLPSFVPNFMILGQVVPEKSLTEIFVREKEKWINKGTDKQYVADSLLHSTTCHYQVFFTKFHDPRSSSS